MAGDPSEPMMSPPPAASADGDAAETGAPIPPGAVDEELLRLPQPAPTRHPGVAAAVLLLGVLLLSRLWSDLSYSLQSDTPRDAGDARAALAAGGLTPGGHVLLTGMPDHRNAVAFDARGARSRSSLFRLLGSGSQVLVVADSGPPTPTPPENRFSGRLRRLDDLSYAETIRGFYETRAQVLRALDLSALQLPAGAAERPLALPLSVRDRAGETLKLEAGTELRVQVAFRDDLRVLLSKEKFPAESDAAREVARLGLPQGPGVETPDGFGYVLRLPPGAERHPAILRVDARGFFYQARVETFRAPAASLVVTAAGLRIPGPAALPQPVRYLAPTPAVAPAAPSGAPAAPAGAPAAPAAAPRLTPASDAQTLLPWADIEAVLVSAPLRPSPQAVVLVAGETPASLRLWVVPLALLLISLMAFNLWYLLAALRRPAEPPAT